MVVIQITVVVVNVVVLAVKVVVVMTNGGTVMVILVVMLNADSGSDHGDCGSSVIMVNVEAVWSWWWLL